MATSSSGDDSPSDLVPPSYPEMIVAAIASLAEDNGSSQAAISRRIEAEARGDLPASHPALVAAHLARMSAAGELVAVAGGKYALPPPPPAPPAPESPIEEDDDLADEEPTEPVPPPAKRGRGRPPKVRPPGFPSAGARGAAVAGQPAAPRRRGRPPKPRDPLAPPKIPRPRGRPRKNPLPEGMAPRPRPVPPTSTKPRPQFAEVGFV
ncbi:hypothetical protein QOZ80_3AG0219060 [Eleusine coracana subsp. coracana]|nr:hypothetical protein QOZ80_3AG0219060 [Eleusine coracana subsp. coracana]